jgi:hypothetical protein
MHRAELIAEAERRGIPRPIYGEQWFEMDPPPWLRPYGETVDGNV